MIFAPRYKRYAAWPVVIWCRLTGHADQAKWDFEQRCLRCGDPLRFRLVPHPRGVYTVAETNPDAVNGETS